MHSLRKLLVLALILITAAFQPLAAETPRFDYWSETAALEKISTAEQNVALALDMIRFASLPDLTDYEMQTLQLFRQVLKLMTLNNSSADPRERIAAVHAIEAMADDEDTLPEVRAAANEFLVRFGCDENGNRLRGSALTTRIDAALAFWAASTDLERARPRYIALALSFPAESNYSYLPREALPYSNHVRDILRRAVAMSRKGDPQVFLHMKLASACASNGRQAQSPALRREEIANVQAAIALMKADDPASIPLLIDALNALEREGDNPDFAPALALADAVLRHAETAPRTPADAKSSPESVGNNRYLLPKLRGVLDRILLPVVESNDLPTTLLPHKTYAFKVASRNIAKLTATLRPISEDDYFNWTLDKTVRVSRPKPNFGAPCWNSTIGDLPADGHSVNVSEIRLPDTLEPGFYVLSVEGAGEDISSFVAVSRSALTLKASGRKATVFACDIETGAPLPGVEVILHYFRTKSMTDPT
ncbi:MAG TPA: hypothetical protein PKI32_08735, partial [Opitutales bacterium]|nr:hypothetical protein [Opitutales bacterium]